MTRAVYIRARGGSVTSIQVQGVTAQVQSATQININWTFVPGISVYNVRINGVNVGTAGQQVAYNATGLTPNTSYSFQVSTVDSSGNEGTLSTPVTATTLSAGTLVINTASPLPAATTGTAYSQTLNASGTPTPYTWVLLSGSFPAGISMSSAGVISGTPTSTGTFTANIQVQDTLNDSATKPFQIVSSAPLTLTITTTSPLPAGTQGTAYNLTLAASGTPTPYTWTLLTGAFPAGVTMSSAGVISGTPTSSGNFTVSIRAADTGGRIASKTFTLSIAAQQTGTPYGPLTGFQTVTRGLYYICPDAFGAVSNLNLSVSGTTQHDVKATAGAQGYNDSSGNVQCWAGSGRGWRDDDGFLQSFSPDGVSNYTTAVANMGIQVSALNRCVINWQFVAPLSSGTTLSSSVPRTDDLSDNYIHAQQNPTGTQKPMIDIQILPQIQDETDGNTQTVYKNTLLQGSFPLTFSGNTYDCQVDNPHDVSLFVASGGHVIALYARPNAYHSNNANPNWGIQSPGTATLSIDLAQVIAKFTAANPKDDNGNAIKNASGATVTAALINTAWYLTTCGSGHEITASGGGTVYQCQHFDVSINNETTS